MTKEELIKFVQENYGVACDTPFKDDNIKIFRHLNNKKWFAALMRVQENKIRGVGEKVIDILDDPCSVLEMMIALAIRIEETMMDDPRYGDRTNQWFWLMMSNLGLKYMTDDVFDKVKANDIIYTFLERQYSPDGKGGLFYIRNCEEDLTQIEIGTQVNWYLNKFI